MSLLKQRLELKKKLEGKLTDEAPIKKEQKSVSKLVIPQMFTKTNTEEKSKSLNTSLSKSTGNLLSSSSTRKLSTSLFKSNSIQVEVKPEVLIRGSSEQRLSSKSFSIPQPTEYIPFDDVKPNSRPKSYIEDTSKSSNTLSVSSDSSSQSNTSADSTYIPVIVGSIRKNSTTDNSTTSEELKNTFDFVRSPKPTKKEETVLHFNFAVQSDSFTKQVLSPNIRRISSMNRRGSRCAILVPEDNFVDDVFEEILKEDLENVEVPAMNYDKEKCFNIETNQKYYDHIENISDSYINTTVKKSNRKEDEIYVNIDVFRQFYDNNARIKFGPIKKRPIPNIRYSLLKK